MLKELLSDLKSEDFEMELAGFGASALDGLLTDQAAPEAPDDFPEVDEDIPTEYECPKCSFKWSGKPA